MGTTAWRAPVLNGRLHRPSAMVRESDWRSHWRHRGHCGRIGDRPSRFATDWRACNRPPGDPAMEQLVNPETWIALATLTALELVLGIDNIIFISILAGKLPPGQRDKARRVGI